MLPRTLGDYGGPRVDQEPVKNPQTQVSAASLNRLQEDVAQLTRPANRAWVHFATAASNPITVFGHASVWGSSDTQKPTVNRSALGIYVITYPTTLLDALGVSETVSFRSGWHSLLGATDGFVRITTIAANVVTVKVQDTSHADADLVGNAVEVFLL